jgi:hypothetical protein
VYRMVRPFLEEAKGEAEKKEALSRLARIIISIGAKRVKEKEGKQ